MTDGEGLIRHCVTNQQLAEIYEKQWRKSADAIFVSIVVPSICELQHAHRALTYKFDDSDNLRIACLIRHGLVTAIRLTSLVSVAVHVPIAVQSPIACPVHSSLIWY